TPAVIGDDSKLQVGQTAIAIGSPRGTFTETVTKGILSATGRTLTVRDEGTGRPTTLNDLLQTDAAINPGNSGGPLLDASGAVVGINTPIAGNAAGLGFAIPIQAARRRALRLRSPDKGGAGPHRHGPRPHELGGGPGRPPSARSPASSRPTTCR